VAHGTKFLGGPMAHPATCSTPVGIGAVKISCEEGHESCETETYHNIMKFKAIGVYVLFG